MSHSYDPQKLLPSPEKARPLTLRNMAELWRSLYRESYGSLVEWAKQDGYLEEPLNLMSPRAPTFRHVDFTRLYDGISHPEVVVTPKPRHKMAVIDIASIEMRTIAHLAARDGIRCIMLDLDDASGEIDGAGFTFEEMMRDRKLLSTMALKEKQVVATSAGKRDKSYLKHDPSKHHKRRKRR